jgi:hypothetical protein
MMPAIPQRSAVTTLRRDLNSEYVALARVVRNGREQDVAIMQAMAGELDRIRAREWIWAGASIVFALCFLVLGMSHVVAK